MRRLQIQSYLRNFDSTLMASMVSLFSLYRTKWQKLPRFLGQKCFLGALMNTQKNDRNDWCYYSNIYTTTFKAVYDLHIALNGFYHLIFLPIPYSICCQIGSYLQLFWHLATREEQKEDRIMLLRTRVTADLWGSCKNWDLMHKNWENGMRFKYWKNNRDVLKMHICLAFHNLCSAKGGPQ